MNCLDYRRRIETEPTLRAESLSQHAAGCAACSDFTRRILHLNQRINDTLNVPVPENLEARILLRQSFQEPMVRLTGWRSPWAMAAGILLVISLVTGGGAIYFNAQTSLENDILTVVNSASYAMESRGPVSTAEVSKVFNPLGLHIAEDLGHVSFAGKCLIQGKAAGHMILRRNGRPITLIFIPNRNRLFQANFSNKQWQGTLVPVASGTVAIIAQPELELAELRERVKKLVHWNTAV